METTSGVVIPAMVPAGNGPQFMPTVVPQVGRSDFPKDFYFGAASSAYQFEGAASEDGKGQSIWDVFTQRYPGKIEDGSNGNVAVDSYHLYKEDVKILKKMGMNAYRFSISWSRILPGGKLNGGVNKKGIKYYNDLIDELLANDIEPFATLFHWDVPQVLQDEYGGFLSSHIIGDFCDFVELCFWEFGDRIKNWITFNEPWSHSVGGYVYGTNAPGRGPCSHEHIRDNNQVKTHRRFHTNQQISHGDPGREPYLVSHNQLLAHAAAVELYRNKFQGSQKGIIGITLVSQWIDPLDEKNDQDIQAAIRGLDFMLGWFMEPLTTGDYPQSMKELVGARLPGFSEEQAEKLKKSYDFIGINYYTASYATTTTTQPNSGNLSYTTDSQATLTPEKDGKLIGPVGGSGWLHVYPKGIRDLLVYVKKKYDDPIIYITENGIDEENNIKLPLKEARFDQMRIDYHRDHLFYLYRAISEGVRVRGYFAWSFLDNFEWSDGYSVRFGIIYVDFKNGLTRHLKESAIWFMNFLKHGCYVQPKSSSSKRSIAATEEQQPPAQKKKLKK